MNFVRRIFPRTRARLQRISDLRANLERVQQKWQLTGEELALTYYGLALEYERERYWFMARISPVIGTVPNTD